MTEEGELRKNIAGGSATGGGINFQAAVTAITAIHMASGSKLGWFDSVLDDVPIEVLAETGGAGDDIQIRYFNGSVAEVQVKKGLRKGSKLWEALIDLVRGVKAKEITHGLLVVCPNTSDSIKVDLSRDIHRIGDGRTDGLKEISKEFIAKLKALDISPEKVCQRLRIITVHTLDNNSANIASSQSELRHICADSNQITSAWDSIYKDATKLIEFRGRRTVASVMQVLDSSRITVIGSESSQSPVSILSSLCKWTIETNSSFSIFGIQEPLLLDKAWLPLKTVVQQKRTLDQASVEEALEYYHGWQNRKYNSDEKSIEPTSIGRFIKHCVVIAGPGMGKSTLLKKLALVYAKEGMPAIKVRLSSLAARMKNGGSFEEGILSLGLDGSGVDSNDFKRLGSQEWILLCDGLDEVGTSQEMRSEGLKRFVAGNPRCRVIVTTRPVGYSLVLLKGWRHYELLPLLEDKADAYIYKLLSGLYKTTSQEFSDYLEFACSQLKKNKEGKVIERSPLLLGLATSLALRKVDFGHSKTSLFKQLFKLVDDASNYRLRKPHVSEVEARSFLEVLGWVLFKHPVLSQKEVLNKCAEIMAPKFGLPKLSAISKCESLFSYWEEVGLVEKIQYSGANIVTFIHKSFSEYAAALYIAGMGEVEQRTTIVSELSSNPDSEVLKFTASLGPANLIIAEIIKRVKKDAAETDWIKRALVSLGRGSKLVLEPKDRDFILDTAFRLIGSGRYSQSRSIAIAMLSVSRQYPEEVAQRSQELVNSQHSWVRLSAWAFITNAGSSYYEFDGLVAAFESLPEMSEPGFSNSLLGFSLNRESFSEIREEFISNAIPEIINRIPKKADKILSVLKQDNLKKTVGFSLNISELLRSLGKESLAKDLKGYLGRSRAYFNNAKFDKASNIAHIKILRSLIDSEQVTVSPSQESNDGSYRLIHLGAFLDASSYYQNVVSDVWSWQADHDDESVREVFRGIIEIADIDKAGLSQEVNIVLGRISTAMDRGEYYSFYMDVEHVDINLDLEGVKSINLDIEKLERALHHKSDWIVQLAANLLANLDDKEELQRIVVRVLKVGEGVSLWAIAQIAKEVDMNLKQLLIERLQNHLVPGCQYLYKELCKLNIKLTDEVNVILQNGLLKSGPVTAEEATQLITKLTDTEKKKLTSLMEEAYQYWLNHEQPYPKGGGTIPESPRKSLLTILICVGSVSDCNLLNYVSDMRSDVQAVAENELVRRLNDSEPLRTKFIDVLAKGKVNPRVLTQVFRQPVVFTNIQCDKIANLLSNKNAQLRFIAMEILESGCLSNERVVGWLELLKNDDELEIREKALAIHESMGL